jgi:GH24 family phage-related lysozyme (muramidase)
LCVHDPANGKLYRVNVGAGTVVYGQWAQAPHTNSKMERKERAARRTWTLYLDKRVLNANYAVHVPGGDGGRA